MSWTKSSISTFTNTPHPPTTTINKPWCRLEGGQENKIETKGEYRLALALLLLNALTTIIYNALFLVIICMHSIMVSLVNSHVGHTSHWIETDHKHRPCVRALGCPTQFSSRWVLLFFLMGLQYLGISLYCVTSGIAFLLFGFFIRASFLTISFSSSCTSCPEKGIGVVRADALVMFLSVRFWFRWAAGLKGRSKGKECPFADKNRIWKTFSPPFWDQTLSHWRL